MHRIQTLRRISQMASIRNILAMVIALPITLALDTSSQNHRSAASSISVVGAVTESDTARSTIAKSDFDDSDVAGGYMDEDDFDSDEDEAK
mmetsp:Transcript_61432/g.165782  ORF Transcript_61432/g.165782 Transcript_61432/m.165782 type:complete len:91 (-) Transcript_61432:154-426(-)